MAVSYEELLRQLTKLTGDIPALVAIHPDADDFNAAFAQRADEITAVAGVDEEWAFDEIDGILQHYNCSHLVLHDLRPDE